MKLEALTIDPSRIDQGDWVDDIPDCGDLRIRTRGIENADYRQLFQTKVNAVPRRERRAGLSAEASRRITVECLVATCLLDWENLDVPFSKAKALELLLDPRYEPLRDACLYAATSIAQGRKEAAAEDAKN